MKQESWLGRNLLKKNGEDDRSNALSCGLGRNLRNILRHQRMF
jgi:hypothetical protein